MAEEQTPDFLTLPPREYPSDDDIVESLQSTIDTRFSSFAPPDRMPPIVTLSSSPRVTPIPRSSPLRNDEIPVDLRALDYPSNYDTHLMCPICHIPFIEPVVLGCDHTFCGACLQEYQNGTRTIEGSQCPSCRTVIVSRPKKASRLISNMCNDIKVACPNEGCPTILARGYIERHVSKECPEQQLRCPEQTCERRTKRKDYIPLQCIHDTHRECDCGAVIELGKGEWLRHKDEDCPNTAVTCQDCGERIPAKDYFSSNRRHSCESQDTGVSCPGRDFGCQDDVGQDEMADHAFACPLARLAPFLSRQSRLLTSLSEQLSRSKMRNDALETGLEQINESLAKQLRSRTPAHLQMTESEEVEEIEREFIPSATDHRQDDALLPTHMREFSPAAAFPPYPFHAGTMRPPGSAASHQHLLALHDSLRSSILSLETDVHQLHLNITELDARSSMQIMNETLRLKEELAHSNAALFSTRAQVQWLLNKDRIGANAAMGPIPGIHPYMMRRQSSLDQTNQVHHQGPYQGQGQSTTIDPSIDTAGPPSASASANAAAATGVSASANTFAAGFGASSSQSSNTTSPIFGATGLNSNRRPSLRRHSGGSQDRVKL